MGDFDLNSEEWSSNKNVDSKGQASEWSSIEN